MINCITSSGGSGIFFVSQNSTKSHSVGFRRQTLRNFILLFLLTILTDCLQHFVCHCLGSHVHKYFTPVLISSIHNFPNTR